VAGIAAEHGRLLLMAHLPRLDEVPESPIDWVDIPLGVGQEPTGFVHSGAFQYTKDGDDYTFQNVRRNPAETWQFISRVPERP